jgi:glycosyltransferase involved in cell wall biosynthesis
MVKNRNFCLSLARGEYVKWLHADDFLCSQDALAQMVNALDQAAVASLVASARRIVDGNSHIIDVWSGFERERPIAGTTVINRCLLEQRNLIGGPSAVMFRRTLARRGFDESFFVMADLEMWFHLLEQGYFAYLCEPLCAMRSHGGQQTARDRESLAPALENRELLRRYLHKSYVQLRRWIWKYLEYDAVRRIVRRGGKLGLTDPRIDQAVTEWGGWTKFRRETVKYQYRENLLKIRRIYERHLRRSMPRDFRKRRFGLNVVGFAQSVYGIGESSRAIWKAVQATGIPSVLLKVSSDVHLNTDPTVSEFARNNPYRINLLAFSFDYSRRFYRDVGPRFFAGRYNIGHWFWEQENFPVRWHSAFDYYDEIWVPTEFVRNSIARSSPIPVHKLTQPFSVNEAEAVPHRKYFGLPEDDLIFLFTFDFFSTIQRKNPAAVIAAFRRAFRPNEQAVLVLKSINWKHQQEQRASLGEQANGARIIFLDQHFSSAEMNSLFASTDCYISLHRAEGVGLGMAHAMYLAKPVIATNYSGNLDFMNRENSLLVDYTMAELEEDAGAYERGSRWADANVEQAATFMRWVYENREKAAALGSRAAKDVRQTLDPNRTAAEISARIQELA